MDFILNDKCNGTMTCIFLPEEADLTNIHVSCFLEVSPWGVHNINVVHLAACGPKNPRNITKQINLSISFVNLNADFTTSRQSVFTLNAVIFHKLCTIHQDLFGYVINCFTLGGKAYHNLIC